MMKFKHPEWITPLSATSNLSQIFCGRCCSFQEAVIFDKGARTVQGNRRWAVIICGTCGLEGVSVFSPPDDTKVIEAVANTPKPDPAPASVPAEVRRQAAKQQGYEGDACSDCGNFTLVRNGTCLKCNTCGGTSGCS